MRPTRVQINDRCFSFALLGDGKRAIVTEHQCVSDEPIHEVVVEDDQGQPSVAAFVAIVAAHMFAHPPEGAPARELRGQRTGADSGATRPFADG